MKRTIQILAVLLVAQLLLAVALFLPGTPLGRSASAGGPLVEFDPAAIDRITIEGPEDARVALARRDGAWQVDGDTMFPADARRVEELLDRLAKLQAGDVVATSASAHERFKVADESFERRVTLASGERTVATLYGGTSPALRRLHVRAGGEDEVRIAELAAYDIPVQGKDWRDTSVLAIPEDEIAAIEVADLRIERAPRSEGDEDEGKDGDTGGAGPAWIVAGGDTREPVNKEVADKVARAGGPALRRRPRHGGEAGVRSREPAPAPGCRAPGRAARRISPGQGARTGGVHPQGLDATRALPPGGLEVAIAGRGRQP